MVYKNFDIKVTNEGEFKCEELDLNAETYKVLCGMIDRETKKEWEKVPALKLEGGYGLRETKVVPVTITSVSHSKYGSYVWIKSSDGRSKDNITNLIADTPDNRETLQKIVAMRNEASKLEKEANRLKENLSSPPLPKEKVKKERAEF